MRKIPRLLYLLLASQITFYPVLAQDWHADTTSAQKLMKDKSTIDQSAALLRKAWAEVAEDPTVKRTPSAGTFVYKVLLMNFLELGRAYDQYRMFDKSMVLWNWIVPIDEKLNNKEPIDNARVWRANSLIEQGKFDDAKNDLKKVEQVLAPQRAKNYTGLTLLAFNEGNYKLYDCWAKLDRVSKDNVDEKIQATKAAKYRAQLGAFSKRPSAFN